MTVQTNVRISALVLACLWAQPFSTDRFEYDSIGVGELFASADGISLETKTTNMSSSGCVALRRDIRFRLVSRETKNRYTAHFEAVRL